MKNKHRRQNKWDNKPEEKIEDKLEDREEKPTTMQYFDVLVTKIVFTKHTEEHVDTTKEEDTRLTTFMDVATNTCYTS